MSVTIEQLNQSAETIRTNTLPSSNSAEVVGGHLKKINTYLQEQKNLLDEELDDKAEKEEVNLKANQTDVEALQADVTTLNSEVDVLNVKKTDGVSGNWYERRVINVLNADGTRYATILPTITESAIGIIYTYDENGWKICTSAVNFSESTYEDFLDSMDSHGTPLKDIASPAAEALAKKVDKVAGSSLVPDTKVEGYDAHLTSTSNPHNVTKSQVGLGNVDNTSDAEKPISTAAQAALNGKANSSDLSSLSTEVSRIGSKTDIFSCEETEVITDLYDKDNYELPLLCGQPSILFGADTPQEAVVPDNWIQLADGGYNWNGTPSALGQQYINTSVSSGGRYIAVRNNKYGLKWLNC